MNVAFFVQAANACQTCQKAPDWILAYEFRKEVADGLLTLLLKAEEEREKARGTEQEDLHDEIFYRIFHTVSRCSLSCFSCNRAGPKVRNELRKWIDALKDQKGSFFSEGGEIQKISKIIQCDFREKKRI